jgi:hypothetical protein
LLLQHTSNNQQQRALEEKETQLSLQHNPQYRALQEHPIPLNVALEVGQVAMQAALGNEEYFAIGAIVVA